tara:strand:- start:267 stop:605 length:339 start_codon:yes stop_codon:yes gene_type:complete
MELITAANIKCEIDYGSLNLEEMIMSVVYCIKDNYEIKKCKVFPNLDKNGHMKVHFMCEKTAINFKIDFKNKKMTYILLSLVGNEEESKRSQNFNDVMESNLDVEKYQAVFF